MTSAAAFHLARALTASIHMMVSLEVLSSIRTCAVQISNAYEVLSDDQKKSLYDR